MRRPVALPPAWTIRRAEWPPSRPSASAPWRSASKRTPSRSQLVDARRRLVAEHARPRSRARRRGRRRACRRHGGRASRRRLAPRRSRPAPSSWPSRASGVRETSVTRAPSCAAVRAQKRPAAPAPITATSVRGAVAGVRSTGRRYGNDTWRRSTSVIPPRSSTTPAPTPSAPSEFATWRRRWRRATGSAGRCGSAPPADERQLLRVHPPEHLERVRAACADSRPLDPDTPVVPASWDAALHAAGGACALVDALLDGSAPTGFAALRPPGHHAEPDRAMGFCLFSNVAIAARHALAAHGAERVLVLDWDVHHGNGTQAVFYDSDASPVRQPPPLAVLSRHRGGRRDRQRCRDGLHAQPAPARRLRDRRLADRHRRARAAGGARLPARPDPRLRRLRRPPRRPARRLPARRRRVRGDGGSGGGAGRRPRRSRRRRARGRLRPRRAGGIGDRHHGGTRGPSVTVRTLHLI